MPGAEQTPGLLDVARQGIGFGRDPCLLVGPERIAYLNLTAEMLVHCRLTAAYTVAPEFIQIRHNRPPTLPQRGRQAAVFSAQSSGSAVRVEAEMDIQLECAIRQQRECPRDFTAGREPTAGVLQSWRRLIHRGALRRRISSRNRFSTSPCFAAARSRETSFATRVSLGSRRRREIFDCKLRRSAAEELA